MFCIFYIIKLLSIKINEQLRSHPDFSITGEDILPSDLMFTTDSIVVCK